MSLADLKSTRYPAKPLTLAGVTRASKGHPLPSLELANISSPITPVFWETWPQERNSVCAPLALCRGLAGSSSMAIQISSHRLHGYLTWCLQGAEGASARPSKTEGAGARGGRCQRGQVPEGAGAHPSCCPLPGIKLGGALPRGQNDNPTDDGDDADRGGTRFQGKKTPPQS